MCRWIAYTGRSIFIEQVVTLPTHSLVKQSIDARMRFSEEGTLLSINADGFGVGWYSDRTEPGLFKDELPAWANENLHEICKHVKANIFFAHVRARTTGAVQRSNCHPFKYKNWMFQHNGSIGEFEKIRQDLHKDIAPELYPKLKGTTDSETFFLLALTYGLQNDPKDAIKKTIKRIQKAFSNHKVKGDINLSSSLSDGKTLYTTRYAENVTPLTQFYSYDSNWVHDSSYKSALKQSETESTIFVSEPLDRLDHKWIEVPDNSFTVTVGNQVQIENLF